jgi:hypothetical protein
MDRLLLLAERRLTAGRSADDSRISFRGVVKTFPLKGATFVALGGRGPRHRRQRVRHRRRAVRLRQEHADQHPRRARGPDRRAGARRREAGDRARTRTRRDLPAVRPVPVADRPQNVEFGLRTAKACRRPSDAAAGRALHRPGRAGPVRRRAAQDALRRHEAALRHRPRVRGQPVDPADGRAVRRARRADPGPVAGAAPARPGARRSAPSCSSPTTSTRRSSSPTGSIVMAARPGRIVEVVDVDLPYPRTEDIRLSPGVHGLRNRVWHVRLPPAEVAPAA